jgi:hypothetical protein
MIKPYNSVVTVYSHSCLELLHRIEAQVSQVLKLHLDHIKIDSFNILSHSCGESATGLCFTWLHLMLCKIYAVGLYLVDCTQLLSWSMALSLMTGV